MKVRVIEDGKIGDNTRYIPQYFDEIRRSWYECHLNGNLVQRFYYDKDKCIEICKEYQKLHPDPVVVWESN